MYQSKQVIQQTKLAVINPTPGHSNNDNTGHGRQIESRQKNSTHIFMAILNQACKNQSNKNIRGHGQDCVIEGILNGLNKNSVFSGKSLDIIFKTNPCPIPGEIIVLE